MRGRLMLGILPGVLAGMLAGPSCTVTPFSCGDDSQCVSDQGMGRCESPGYCSFPDEDCDSGWVYGSHAGGELAGQCVGEGGGSSTVDGGTTLDPVDLDTTFDTDSSDSTMGSATTVDSTTDDPTTGEPTDAWFDCSFPTRYRLEPSGARGGTSLTDFETLVTLTPARIDLDAIGPAGNALCFVTPDGMPLPWEIDTFTPGDSLLAWVTLESVERGAYVYLYVGGDPAACTTDPIWANNDYVGVYHLGDPVIDGSPAGNDPEEVTPALVSGVIGDARMYDEDTDVVVLPPSPSLTGMFEGGGTITAWVRPAVDTGERRIVERAESGEGASGFLFLVHGSTLELRRGGGTNNGSWGSDIDLGIGTWHHVAVVFDDDDPSAGASFWLDGVSTRSAEITPLVGSPDLDPTLTTQLGRAPPELGNLQGRLDEVHLSTVARSDEWITHRFLSDTDALLDYGPPESSACASRAEPSTPLH